MSKGLSELFHSIIIEKLCYDIRFNSSWKNCDASIMYYYTR